MSSPLLDRPPGAGVITRCLALNAATPRRGVVARIFGRTPLSSESTSWYRGALGELTVGARLRRLNEDWTVMHSVPIGKHDTDIDHVVIGPTGVFTVNTKRHPRARIWLGAHMLMINGQKTDYLRKARAEALQASRRRTAATGAPIAVTPIIVLVGTKSINVRQRPADVAVLRDAELARWLQSKRRGESSAPSTALLAAAAGPETWHANGAAAVGAFDESDNASFSTLRRSVNRAAMVRAAWAIGVVVIVPSVAFDTVLRVLAG